MSVKEVKQIQERIAEVRENEVSLAKIAKVAHLNYNTVLKLNEGKIKNPKKSTVKQMYDALNSLVPTSKTKTSKQIKEAEKEQEKRGLTVLPRTIERALPKAEIVGKEVQTPVVEAIIEYTVRATAKLDVNEKIISVSPLKTERIYTNPRDVKVESSSLTDNQFDIISIRSEFVSQEPAPAYIR